MQVAPAEIEPSAKAEDVAAGGRPGAMPTLFLIPGTGGDNEGLASLRAEWSGRLDCVLLDYPDWPTLAASGFGMDALEADFVRRIQQAAPAGPVWMAGYSLGGFMAWAVARRLSGTPRAVQKLFILDADASQPLPVVTHASLARRAARLIGGFAAMLLSGERARLAKLIGEFIGHRLVRRRALLRRLAALRWLRLPRDVRHWLHFAIASELQVAILRPWMDNLSAETEALAATRVVLLRSRAPQDAADPQTLGWQARCCHLLVAEVEGDHHSLLHLRCARSLYARLPALAAED